MSGGENKARTIKLFCPSAWKLVSMVAWDAQKLDLGSIARAFGLDPSTVKLNGHFISRGKDLVSSSVTWRSLLSFFSSKGLSTGTQSALIVGGKLCKLGTKRAHEPFQDGVGNTRKLQQDNLDSIKSSKKLRNSSSDAGIGSNWRRSSRLALGCKRKSFLMDMEDVSLLKRLKINQNNPADFQSSKVPSNCSYLSGNRSMKRMREDEVILGASCKRITTYGCHAN
ncbi:hypothetical protein COLO4_15647 [Corchorus olitorius]|uniref:Uncharacterized protein n=1 Tax=Corchorus olitorius TaxID=93759 RepID=A0A1R3JLW1_9ROSI|nr:hypothetical protein COLO4_15647 [Corchorus olitorius]